MLFSVSCLLCTVCYLLLDWFVVCSLFFVVLLFVVLLFAVYCFLIIVFVYSVLFTVYCFLFIMYCLFLFVFYVTRYLCAQHSSVKLLHLNVSDLYLCFNF